METQNLIKRTLSLPESIERIQNLLSIEAGLNRAQLADKICERFDFYDPCGKKQLASCQKALRELEKKGHFVLPPPCRSPGKRSPVRLGKPVPEPQEVPGKAGDIKELALVLIEDKEQKRIWNELMFREHPRRTSLFVGRQIYYLVVSEHGWLGGVGFSVAALHLEDRDKWIGWDADRRLANLHHVVNMNRFLIRPSVSCHNLASHVLGMTLRTMPKDFENRYGYRPLLVESFVDTDHFAGTCYQAANFECIGRTKGRGRQDRFNEQAESIKDIYIYPLAKDFREKMGIPLVRYVEAIDLTAGLNDDIWAENEFGGAPLKDKRLSNRLVEIADIKSRKPGDSFSGAAGGDWAKVKGYYRMIEKPNDSAVSMENILLPHRERTIGRMKDQESVLCIQDGTTLNYDKLDTCEGLGVISKNQTGAQSRGLHLHSTFAVTTEGLPLGILRAECSAPELKSEKDPRSNAKIPIEEKKTFCWIEGNRDCAEVKKLMPETRIISVMDREADFFELFDDHRTSCASIDLLVRAKHNRKTTGELNLFETARQSSVKTLLRVHVPRQSAKTKKSKQKARPKRKSRTAEVSLRYKQVELNAPSHQKDKKPIALYLVHVSEDNPPDGVEALEWFLLTTIEVKSVEEAEACVKWYILRWRIEDWHRVLKSGCNILGLAHKTAERLRRAVAINMVIAWRIMLMTLLGRETPELPPDVLFSDLEIEVLTAYAPKKNSFPRIHWA